MTPRYDPTCYQCEMGDPHEVHLTDLEFFGLTDDDVASNYSSGLSGYWSGPSSSPTKRRWWRGWLMFATVMLSAAGLLVGIPLHQRGLGIAIASVGVVVGIVNLVSAWKDRPWAK